MIKNYFLVAIRHLKRQPAYAFLNIFGLTIGIVSALLITLYLNYELSFDEHHENNENIYRISSDIAEPDNAFRWATTQAPLGRTVKEEFSEINQYTRFAGGGDMRMELDGISYSAENLFLTDSTVFDVFTFEFIRGDKSALNAPNSIVLSKTLADRIFKGDDPMGRLLETERFSYEVTGVFEDMPNTSHIIADALVSFSTNQNYHNSQSWGGFGLYTYVVLNENSNSQEVVDKLNTDIIDKYVATIFDQFDIKIKYELINIRDIHLKSTFEGEPTATGNIDYVYIFFAVAIFLILIACINYMNLATARSMRRSLEVGLRKVMGAQRNSLIRQFIVESILITLISFILSLLVLLLAAPAINNLVGTNLELSNLLSGKIILTCIGIMIITGLVGGSYPAFYLSAFSPINAIKGGGTKRTGNVWLRRILVGIQFAISIFMLAGTVIIYQQMQFVRNADLGFDKDQVVNFSMNRNVRESWPVLKTKLMENPAITRASTSSTAPGNGYGKNVMNVETNEGVMESYGIDSYAIDYDFFGSLDIEIVEGRNISSQYVTDTATSVLINEAMVERMGWSDPIGKRFQFDQDSTVFHKVIGVAKNFHQQSMYNPIEALLFIPNLNNSQALVKVDGDFEEGIAHIKASWEELFPNIPFEYQLLDQNFIEEYEEDQLRGQLFLGFSFMMIIISGLGLLGLASFTAEQRTKEISIRKVLGASVKGLISLLVKDFVWLVIIGAIPAFVVSYYLMNTWLDTFEYHISVSFLVFIFVLIVTIIMVVFTTGYHALKASTTNPSQNLKYE
ncbi:MAG: ABC transporter permease [Cyclobacteriaceae bacterium]